MEVACPENGLLAAFAGEARRLAYLEQVRHTNEAAQSGGHPVSVATGVDGTPGCRLPRCPVSPRFPGHYLLAGVKLYLLWKLKRMEGIS